MKPTLLTTFLLFALSTCFAQTKPADPWTNYMTPGAGQKILENYTGEWDLETTLWMEDNKPPQTVRVSSSNRMILGGRYLELTQRGDMMGMEYEAKATMGFNTTSQRLELTFLTNIGTGILYLTGAWKDTSKPAVVSGQLVNPENGRPIHVRQVITFSNANTLIIENYDRSETGKERKSMQYKLTRKN